MLEFDEESAALSYFSRDFLPHFDALSKRCVFVENEKGELCATAMAWYAESRLGRQAALNWVSVAPAYQGLGVGKAVVSKAVSLYPSLEPQKDVYLHTQTWSHKAVGLYRRLGFCLCKTETLALMQSGGPKIYVNEYEDAMQVLSGVLPAALLQNLIETAK